MDISQYQIFLKVAACGSFSKAAEALSFTRSGISHAVNSLENELGVTLSSRNRDELSVLDGGKCILQLRGVRPFLSDKYDLTQHPNYKLTSDYDPKNTFDIEKYLNRKEKINPNDEFVVIDADSLPSA